LICAKISLVRLSNKVVSLNLAPFSEKVENHWCRLWRGVVTAHSCWSPTPTVNGRDLTPTQTQTSEQEYCDLTVSIRRPSTPYYRNTPQSFSRGTRSHAFSRSTKHV